MKLLLLASVIALAATVAHADDWRERAKAASAPNDHQRCILYADVKDNRLHVRVPICFYNNGDVYTDGYEGTLSFNGRKAGATHPAMPCNEII
jgi:hypothetical protein